jgi:hypothetical protein
MTNFSKLIRVANASERKIGKTKKFYNGDDELR